MDGGESQTFDLRYVGARFDRARMPVDVLSDLPAFRELLVAFARDQWLLSHTDRKRVPKGFDQSIAIELTGIGQGSAVPKLEWNSDQAQRYLPGFHDELAETIKGAYADLVLLIDGAANDHFPKSLSADHIRALNKLGSGLRDGERIEFQGKNDHNGQVIFLDAERRKRIITRVRETYQSRVDGTGKLIAASAAGQLRLSTVEFGEIQMMVDPEVVLKTFDGNLLSDVQFDLQIELDHNDRFRSVVQVFDIALVDADLGANLNRCRNRLAEVQAAGGDWHDGEGPAISRHAVDKASKFLSKRSSLAAHYRIFPTEEGSVLFEFEVSGWDLSLEFSSNGSVQLFGVEIDGPDEMGPETFNDLDDGFFELFDKITRPGGM